MRKNLFLIFYGVPHPDDDEMKRGSRSLRQDGPARPPGVLLKRLEQIFRPTRDSLWAIK